MFVAVSCSSTKEATAQSGNEEYTQPDNNYDGYSNDDDNAYNENEGENYDNGDDESYYDFGYDDQSQGYDNDSQDYDDESQQPEVNMNVFENELSPYGRWIDYPTYGHVWIANEPNFQPYNTGGHWAYTTYGWTWVSDYSWGWAPFHYGRWAYASNSWMWVPGYQWAPAWVGWRTGGDYYGWAPLSPGINIGIGFGYGGIPANNWYFCNRRYISSPYIGRYCVNRSHNSTIIRNTTIINRTNIYRNNRYATGPDRREVERISGHRITPARISNASRPGNDVVRNNEVHMYRPGSTAHINNNHRPATSTNRQQQQNHQSGTAPGQRES